MSKGIGAFFHHITQRWWWLVGGGIGGVQAILALLGITPPSPYNPWLVGAIALAICFFIAAYLAYRDLYIKLTIEKPSPHQRRSLDVEERLTIRNIKQQMIRKHGHADERGIDAEAHDGTPWSDIMKLDCTLCGKPRNQRGDSAYD